MTWRPSASARSCSPTARAVWPPMPASTSSNTSVARARLGGDAHQRQHHARELAARGGLAQRARRARRGWARSGTRPRRRRVGPGVVARRERDLERRALHRQLGEPVAHRLGQRRAAASARASRSARRAPSASSARAASSSRLGVLERLLGARRARRGARGTRSACSSTAAIVPPCLRFEPVEQRQALLDLVEPARRGASMPSP